MGRKEEVFKERLKKVEELRKQGINPYPYKYESNSNSSELQEKYRSLANGEKSSKEVKIAGRVMSIRDMGKILFAVLDDGYGRIQVLAQEQETPEKVFKFIKKYMDTGDFFGFEGKLFRTKRGELSILIKNAEILSKSLLPLPDKWHGLEEKEERYRKRYLDLLMNPEVKSVFINREKMIDSIRSFLKSKGFVEVETPYLQTIYGGAEARPFKTHLNALDIPLFLAISPELYLKRLIVGGFNKVFSIARNFRNEGIDKWHNPEFTMMEIYQAYADYNDMMVLFESIYEHVCKEVLGTTKVKFGEHILDFKTPWRRVTMAEMIKQHVNIDVLKMSAEELLEFSESNKVVFKKASWGMLVAAIFEHF